jgi:putative transcription factor
MAKKGLNNLDKQCPICGGLIWGKGQKVLIEGAKITVCESCAQHGIKIREKPLYSKPKGISSQKQKALKKSYRYQRENLNEIEVTNNYASLIRKARTSRGLNQDQFAQKLNEKPSLLRRIEAGKVEPTIKLAKKIEVVYKIKLLKKVNEVEISAKASKYMKKPTGSSLGDIAFIKKKKK